MSDREHEKRQGGGARVRRAPWVRLSLWSAVFIVVTGGAALTWVTWPRTATFFTDADRIREPENRAPLRDILWQPAQRLPAIVNSPTDDYEPRVSADGLTLYFVRGRAGENADIYLSDRTPHGWSEPAPLVEIDSAYDDLGPEPSPDGSTLYFYSDRPGGSGGYDLWMIERQAGGRQDWGTPVNLGPLINSPYNDYGATISPDGRQLCFASNRPGPEDERPVDADAWPATLREDLHVRDYDLYLAPLTDRGAGAARRIASLSTPFNDGAPAWSDFGDFLYFASDRPGGEGGFDLFRSRFLRDEFQKAENLGPAVNTAANELDPGLSMGGYALHFSSDRPPEAPNDSESGALGQGGAAGRSFGPAEPASASEARRYDLYFTTSREVFAEHQTTHARIGWEGLWRRIGPNLLLALLALLLLLALLKLFGGVRGRRLSLLVRCLLASLAAHLLLMLLFNVWEVTLGIRDAFRRGGGTRITMVAPARGDTLVTQLRGNLTDVALPEWSAGSPSRPAPEIEHSSPVPRTELAIEHRSTPEPTGSMVSDAVSEAIARVRDIPGAELAPQAVEDAPASLAELAMPHEDVPPADVPEPRQPEVAWSVPQQGVKAEPQPIQVAGVAAPVAIEPVKHKALSADSVLRSFAAESAALEAALPPAAMPDPDPAPAGLNVSVPAEFALRLPDMPTQPAATAEDRAARPIAPIPDGPRAATLAMSVTAASPQGLQRYHVAPETSSPIIDQASLLDDSRMPMDDARVAEAASAQGAEIDMTQSASIRLPESVRLALPQLEELPQNPAETESVLRPDADYDIGRAAIALPGHEDGDTMQSPLEFAPDRRIALVAEDKTLLNSEHTAIQESDTAALKPSLPDTPVLEIASLPQPSLDLPLPREEPPRDTHAEQQDSDASEVTAMTRQAVADALRWLAAHQQPDGRWDSAPFDEQCVQQATAPHLEADIALTSLATLCFLGADHTHVQPSPYADTVAKSLAWLREIQAEDGGIVGQENLYSHGMATLALADAYRQTGDRSLHRTVQRAVDFMVEARDTEEGGWAPNLGQECDTSVLGWQVMAMAGAEQAGVYVPPVAYETARHWMARVERPSGSGLYAYRPSAQTTPAMTAEGLVVQQSLGVHRENPRMVRSVEHIAGHVPSWEPRPYTYFWYFATLGLAHHQGPRWPAWKEPMTLELLDHQRRDGAFAGSWDPQDDPWAEQAGRICQTAMCTLILETVDRHPASQPPESLTDAIGTLRGRIADALTGEAIPAASVRLTIPQGDSLVTESDATGWYELAVPELPPFFALSATADGYVPGTANVETALLRGRTGHQNFRLVPIDETTVALESEPEVHHLGNDRFEGRINSQFQKDSEGIAASITFNLSAAQAALLGARAEIHFMAKGVQCSPRLAINDRLLDTADLRSPADGSFGEVVVRFDPALLRAGENTLVIQSTSCRGDRDDFEFVNARIILQP